MNWHVIKNKTMKYTHTHMFINICVDTRDFDTYYTCMRSSDVDDGSEKNI